VEHFLEAQDQALEEVSINFIFMPDLDFIFTELELTYFFNKKIYGIYLHGWGEKASAISFEYTYYEQ